MADVTNKRVHIYIDQASAEDALQRLQIKADGFSNKIDDARKKQTKLLEEIKKSEAAGKDISKLQNEYNTLGTRINAYNKSLKETTDNQAKVKQQIDAGLTPSFSQLEKHVSRLRNELKNLSQDAPEFAAKFEQFRKSSHQLNQLRDSFNGVEKAQNSWLANAKSIALGVVIGNTVQGALQSLSGYVSGIVSGNAKLSDSLSDIEKATNKTSKEVAQLNTEIGRIDTRTATADLREMAIGLGQIGEAVNKENVAALDKIVVALGDEFSGGARQITKEVSVLRNNLQDIKTGNYADDVSKIGNAINVLGAEGLAEGEKTVDIANRISGVLGTFKVSSGAILGYAATFQELGIEVERGSTAIVKLYQKMAAEPEKFAKVAGVSTAEFKRLVDTNITEAFNKVSEGAKKAGSSNTVFASILKEIDADGSGAGEVISKLGANTELLSKKVITATDALKNNNSITDEFNKKNNNLAANLEKLGKNISSWFTSSGLADYLGKTVKNMVDLTAKTKSANEVFDEQVQKMVHLKTNIEPLLPRYEELTSKSKRSKEEQTEMNAIIKTISETLPSAITQVDKYGNAIGISTDRVTEYIEAEKARLKVVNEKAIIEREKEIKQLEVQNKRLDEMIAERNKTGSISIKVKGEYIGGGKYTEDYYRKATQEEIKQIDETSREVKQKILGTQAELKRLNGDAVQEAINNAKSAAAQREKERKEQETKDKKNSSTSSNPFTDKEDTKRADVLKKLQDFQFELEQVGKKADEKEIDRIIKKYDALIKEAKAYGLNYLQIEKEKNRAVAYLLDEDARKQREAKAKQDKEDQERFLAEQLTRIDEQTQLEKDKLRQSYVDRKITKQQEQQKERELDIENLQHKIDSLQVISSSEYVVDEVRKKAETQLAALRKQLNKERLDDAVKTTDALIEDEKKGADRRYRNEKAGAELDVLTAPNFEARLKAQLRLLEIEKERELANTELTENEKKLIVEKYEQQRSQLIIESATKSINETLTYFQQALGILDQFNNARNAREKAALDREIAANDKRRKDITKLQQQKVISEIEARKRLADIDKEEAAKKEALDKKQFERNKRLQIAQAIINGAMAITSTLAARPGSLDILSLGAFRAINVAIAVATTAAQIASISSTKYGKGGRLTGPLHSEGGMPVINPTTGQKEAEVEGGEYILSRSTVANNRQLADALLYSSMYNSGKSISYIPAYQQRPYQAVNFSGISQAAYSLRSFATGGVLPGASNNTAPQVIIQQDEEMKQMLAVLMNKLDKPLKVDAQAIISLKQIDDARNQKNDILKEAAYG